MDRYYYRPPTRAEMQVKDRSIMPPDRTLFTYHVMQAGTEVIVEGSWGDYLRDVNAGIVVKKHAPLNDSENTQPAMIINDVYGVVPEILIPDPTMPL